MSGSADQPSGGADRPSGAKRASAGAEPRKRTAAEPAAVFFDREESIRVPRKRPGSLIGGTLLVLLRAAGTILWMISVLRDLGPSIADVDLTPEESAVLLSIVLGVSGAWMLLLVLLAWLVWRGSNAARILVMLGTTLSITAAAVSYFSMGEEITVRTTLLTLSLDILILLALSSRDARAWARGRKSPRRDG